MSDMNRVTIFLVAQAVGSFLCLALFSAMASCNPCGAMLDGYYTDQLDCLNRFEYEDDQDICILAVRTAYRPILEGAKCQ